LLIACEDGTPQSKPPSEMPHSGNLKIHGQLPVGTKGRCSGTYKYNNYNYYLNYERKFYYEYFYY
jgi:hypothetical protein